MCPTSEFELFNSKLDLILAGDVTYNPIRDYNDK